MSVTDSGSALVQGLESLERSEIVGMITPADARELLELLREARSKMGRARKRRAPGRPRSEDARRVRVSLCLSEKAKAGLPAMLAARGATSLGMLVEGMVREFMGES